MLIINFSLNENVLKNSIVHYEWTFIQILWWISLRKHRIIPNQYSLTAAIVLPALTICHISTNNELKSVHTHKFIYFATVISCNYFLTSADLFTALFKFSVLITNQLTYNWQWVIIHLVALLIFYFIFPLHYSQRI